MNKRRRIITPPTPPAPIIKQKYLVYIVAGESIAVGYDESPITEAQVNSVSDRVMQLGLYGNDNLEIVPLRPCAQNYQDMRRYSNSASFNREQGTKGIHLPLGLELLRHLPNDVNVLILPCAHGATGFIGTHDGTYDPVTMKPTLANGYKWGATSAQYQALRDRLKYVLDKQDIEAKYAGFIWCQGQHEANNNQPTANGIGFTEMFNQFASDMETYKAKSVFNSFGLDTIYTFEPCGYWYSNYENQMGLIYSEYANKIGQSNYVKVPRNTDTNQTNGTGSTSYKRNTHFGNNAYQNVIAPAVKQAIVTTTPAGVYNNVVMPIPEAGFKKLTFGDGISKLTDATGDFVMTGIKGDVLSLANPISDSEARNADAALNKRTILFDDTYKLVMFRPLIKGFWAIVKNDNPVVTGDFGLVGLLANNFRRLNRLNNKQMSVLTNSTAGITFNGSDVIMLLRATDKCFIARYRNSNDVVEQLIEVSDSSFSAVAGNPIFGATFGYVNNDIPLSTEAPHDTQFLASIVGVQDVSGIFANISAPTQAEWQVAYNKYAAFIKTY